MARMNPLLLDGLTDAVGFVGGVLLAYSIGLALGFNPLAPGYGSATIVGMLMAGAGGGLGVQLARRLRTAAKSRRP